MENAGRIAVSAVISGTAAGLFSTAALALLSRAEGKAAWQPLNATSHWLNGDLAALETDADARHTGIGLGTHHASSIFWALPFQAWLAASPPRSRTRLVARAAAVSAAAAAVDYTLVPKRLRPGWELVLPKRSMVAAFAAMALGLAAGAVLAERLLDEAEPE